MRRCRFNIQYMDNETEQKVFGKITSQIIVLRAQALPDIQKDDTLYLSEPAIRGNFTLQGTTYDDYGPGIYDVLSVMPLRVGTSAAHNPTTVTARIRQGADKQWAM